MFKDEKEVIKFVNDMEYGLVGSVFINDGVKVFWVIKKLCVGIIWVNIYYFIFNEVFWGGYK